MAVVALAWSISAFCWGLTFRTWLAPAPAPAANASPFDMPLVLTLAPAASPWRAPMSTPFHTEGLAGAGGSGALAAWTAGSGAVWGVGIWSGTSDVEASGGLMALVTS